MSQIGKTATIKEGQLAGKSGKVVWERSDGLDVGIEIDGKNEYFPIEMTSINSAKPSGDFSCHYCGMPAKTFGFFDTPVCSECGG